MNPVSLSSRSGPLGPCAHNLDDSPATGLAEIVVVDVRWSEVLEEALGHLEKRPPWPQPRQAS